MATQQNPASQSQQGQPQATANQSNFNVDVIANVVVPKSKGAWIVIVALLAFLLVAWYKNFLSLPTILLTYGVTISGLIAVIIIILFILYGWATCKDDLAKFYIATALFIWMLDLVPENFFLIGPWLGPEWAGFIFPIEDIWQVPWASIFLSGFFFSLLYINMVFNIIEKEYRSFGLGFLFILITNYLITSFFPDYLSYYVPIPTLRGLTFLLILVVIAGIGIAAWKFDKHREGAVPDFFSSLYMIFIFSFFWLNNGWQANIRAWIHAIYIIGFGFSYIKSNEKNNPILWKILIPTLLFVDFFGHGILRSSNILIFNFIPLIVLFVIGYCYHQETETGKKNYTYPVAALILLVTFFLIITLKVEGFEGGNLPFVVEKGTTFNEFYTQFSNSLKANVINRLDYATGGYLSSVEKNQFEPLGVYFTKERYAQPKFYSDEDITIWATLKSRTLSDPVFISFTCFRKTDGKRIEAVIDKGQQENSQEAQPKVKYDKVIPYDPFTVYTLEDKDIECTFTQDAKNSKLQAGTNTIYLSATYNFATSAYQKLYFIDKDRLRTMTRENLEPFKQFSITDVNPDAKFTNGPVQIAVDVQKLIPVAQVPSGGDISPILHIELRNRNKITDKQGKPVGEWQGKIGKIKELIVLLPKGIKIENENECRPVKFKKFKLEDCPSSCTENVYIPCLKACDTHDINCINDCKKTEQTCNTECDGLFKSESEGEIYEGYQLDIDDLYKKYRVDFTDIDSSTAGRYTVFSCRIKPTKDVLENVPITTRFIRIKARYNYSLEKSYSVVVEQAPIPLSDISPFEDIELPPSITKNRPTQTLYTGYPSNTDIDTYFRRKNSELAGIGQCIKDVESSTQIPAIIILGVSNLESDKSGGQWAKLSGLAQLNYNLFGRKCTPSYISERCPFSNKRECCKGYSKKTLDIVYEPNEPNVYRAYPNYCESIQDFGNLISTDNRYSTTMRYTTNPEEMVRLIGKAGYATDLNWANKVIERMRIIKDDLTKVPTTIV